MNRKHWIRDANVGPTKVITHCGREGYVDKGNEYVTALGYRFEAYKSLAEVNCGQCLKSYDRISRSGRVLRFTAKA